MKAHTAAIVRVAELVKTRGVESEGRIVRAAGIMEAEVVKAKSGRIITFNKHLRNEPSRGNEDRLGSEGSKDNEDHENSLTDR